MFGVLGLILILLGLLKAANSSESKSFLVGFLISAVGAACLNLIAM